VIVAGGNPAIVAGGKPVIVAGAEAPLRIA